MVKLTTIFTFTILVLSFFPNNQVGAAASTTSFSEQATIDINVRDMVTIEDKLYVLTPNSVEIYEVSSAEPQQLSSFALTSNMARYLSVADNYVYVTQYQDGLLIIDAHDHENPQAIKHIETSGQIMGRAAAQNDLLYIGFLDAPEPDNSCFGALAEAGIQILNIADRTNPQPISEIVSPSSPPDNGFCDFYAQPLELLLSSDTLFVLLGGNVGSRVSTTQGIWSLDVSDPAAPAELSYTESGRTAYAHGFVANNQLYTTAPPTGPSFFSPPRLSFYNMEEPVSPSNIQTVYGCPPDYVFETCTPFGPNILFHDLVVTEIGLLVTTSEGLWLYEDTGHSRTPLVQTAYQGTRLVAANGLLFLGDGANGITVLSTNSSEPTHRLDVMLTQSSPGSVPPSGGFVEFVVTITNNSLVSTDPITLTGIETAVFGEIAPNPNDLATGDCWWWLPTLQSEDSWSCQFTTLVTATNDDNLFATNLEVSSTTAEGVSITAETTLEIPIKDGEGIGDVAYWLENAHQIETLAQPIDMDGNGTFDMVGFLIGDTNFNGQCDFYEVWWTQLCIALATDEAFDWLQADDSVDNRFAITQELMATWLNIRARNDYLCASMDTAVFITNLWLHDRAPGGNPLNGGEPVEDGATWNKDKWRQSWLKWYNETGGSCSTAQSLALSQDRPTRFSLSKTLRKVQIHFPEMAPERREGTQR